MEPKLNRRKLYRWCFWFQLANALVLSLIAIRYFTFSPLPENLLGWVFLSLIVPGQFLIFSYLLLPVLLGAAGLAPGRWVLALGVLSNALLVWLILVDIQVFILYRYHLNAMVWNLLSSGVASDLLPLSAHVYGLAAGALAGLLAGEALLARWVWLALPARFLPGGFRVSLLLCCLVLVGQGMHVWADATHHTALTRQMRYLPWMGGLTAYRSLERFGLVAEDGRHTAPLPKGMSGLHYPLAPLTCQPSAPRRNVLIIVLESWRFDTLDPTTTPHIHALVPEARVFTNHFSTGSATRYGMFGLMYGLYATYWESMLAEGRGSLLIDEALRQGDALQILSSAPLIHPEFDRTVFARLRDRITLRTGGKTPDQRDQAITGSFLEFLARRRQAQAGTPPPPFLGLLFYDAPHAFTFPPGFSGPHRPQWEAVDRLQLHNGFDPLPFLNRYRNSLNFVDTQVGQVIAALRADNLLENTVLVITGDHGEEFNENRQNYWGHGSNYSRFQTQVPLVIRWPGRGPGRHGQRTSHVDVVPTLLRDVYGCSNPFEAYSNGRHLFDQSPRGHVVANNGLEVALIGADSLTIFAGMGNYTVHDWDYREIADAPPPLAQMQVLMEGMARFYAR